MWDVKGGLAIAVPLKNSNMRVNVAIFEIPISLTVDGLEISEQNIWNTAKTHCNNLKARHACEGTLLSGISSSYLRRQVSSVLSRWITEYIHVFCRYFTHPWVTPCGPSFGCSNLIPSNLSGQPKAVQIQSNWICPAKNIPEWRCLSDDINSSPNAFETYQWWCAVHPTDIAARGRPQLYPSNVW